MSLSYIKENPSLMLQNKLLYNNIIIMLKASYYIYSIIHQSTLKTAKIRYTAHLAVFILEEFLRVSNIKYLKNSQCCADKQYCISQTRIYSTKIKRPKYSYISIQYIALTFPMLQNFLTSLPSFTPNFVFCCIYFFGHISPIR